MTQPLNRKSYASQPPTWCPGCGDYGIWTALKTALARLGLRPDQITIVFGIGCSSNMVNFIRAYGFHGLHGRALPVAEGIRLANHQLPVFIITGDGDGLGEGLGHFIHTIRSNPNVTYLLHDNQVYGLTKGQHSPTAARGFVSTTAPDGVVDEPVNPIALALAAGASFVARGFAGDANHLADLIVEAYQHEGFSFVDALQPCVTFNRHNTYLWYYQRVYELASVTHDPTNYTDAWARAHEPFTEKIPLGVFYRSGRPTLESQMSALSKQPLVAGQPTKAVDVSGLIATYR